MLQNVRKTWLHICFQVLLVAFFLLFPVQTSAQIFPYFGPTNTPLPTASPSATLTPNPSATLIPTGIATPSAAATTSAAQKQTGVFVTNGTDTTVVRDEHILYLGGSFTEVQLASGSSALRQYLASINVKDNVISDWNPSPNNRVEAIAVTADKIYVGGHFTQIAGAVRNYIAVFDKTTGALLGWDPNPNDVVYAIAADDINVYVGGRFTAIGNQNRLHIASFNMATGELNEFNPGADGIIYTIVVDDNYIYLGGEFSVVGGKERRYIAQIDKTTMQVTEWQPRVNNTVRKISVVNGNQIALDGDFTEVNGQPQQSRVVVDPVTGQTVINTPGTTLTLTVQVDQRKLGFRIPNLADILTFMIRAFFVIAGLTALFYLLLGAFGWITSGGAEDSVKAARDKITAAIVGVILIVVVLAIVVTMEQIIFQQRICFGLSCAATIPSLIEPL